MVSKHRGTETQREKKMGLHPLLPLPLEGGGQDVPLFLSSPCLRVSVVNPAFLGVAG